MPANKRYPKKRRDEVYNLAELFNPVITDEDDVPAPVETAAAEPRGLVGPENNLSAVVAAAANRRGDISEAQQAANVEEFKLLARFTIEFLRSIQAFMGRESQEEIDPELQAEAMTLSIIASIHLYGLFGGNTMDNVEMVVTDLANSFLTYRPEDITRTINLMKTILRVARNTFNPNKMSACQEWNDVVNVVSSYDNVTANSEE